MWIFINTQFNFPAHTSSFQLICQNVKINYVINVKIICLNLNPLTSVVCICRHFKWN